MKSALMLFSLLVTQLILLSQSVLAVDPKGSAFLFENVCDFNGTAETLTPPSNVLVVGNVIKSISTSTIDDPAVATATKITGKGRTLMSGLIDAHIRVAGRG